MRIARIGMVLAATVWGCAGDDETETETETETDTETDTDTGDIDTVWADRRIETSETLYAVYTGGTGAWAVGTTGSMWRVNAGGSALVELDTEEDLNGIWGAGDADNAALTLVGTAGTVIDYAVGSPATVGDLGTVNLYDIDGKADLVVAVSWVGAYVHSGSEWVYEQLPDNAQISSVWVGESSVFAVGEDGAIVQRSGGEWTAMTSPTTDNLHAVHGTSDSDVYAVGEDGTVVHYDGTEWTTLTSGTSINLWGVWTAPSGEVFIVGNNGTALQYATPPEDAEAGETGFTVLPTGIDANLYAVSGTALNNVWAVGNRGAVVQFTAE